MTGTAETTHVDGTTIGPHATALSISNAISRLHKQFIGRGPRNTTTTIAQDLVICMLEGGLTPTEQTLRDCDRDDLVAAQRAGLCECMREALVAAVEDLTGRQVQAYMSASDGEFNLRAEIFVLSPAGQTDAAGTAREARYHQHR